MPPAVSSRPASPEASGVARRRLRQIVVGGPRCPDCTGPLVFGEGCHVCPVCGYSSCGPLRR